MTILRTEALDGRAGDYRRSWSAPPAGGQLATGEAAPSSSSTPWRKRASCAGRDTAWWYASPRSFEADVAVSICRRCPVRAECLDDALDVEQLLGARRHTYGIRGGLLPAERLELLAQRSPVSTAVDMSPASSGRRALPRLERFDDPLREAVATGMVG